ncbi:MAG: recombinase family protein, partial [Candidatus Atribacteria bacterium]|nr:recombinase family protein [Candidatus Atribacteria bacterium]
MDGQLRVCKDFAKSRKIKIVGEYIDRALTGKSDDRPQFQTMIDDAKKKTFDYVIVYKLDRFARNRYDSAIYKSKLKQFGVKVLSAMENIGDNPESILLEGMLESWAEYYSIDLSQKVRRGLRESAMKGQFVAGRIPLGYKIVNKKLEIDPTTAPIVQEIFTRYAAGEPKKAIIN